MEAVYIHIPFCSHICAYCDFSKVLHIDTFVFDYLESLKEEINSTYDGEKIKSIYIGGGTPSCLTKKERKMLFSIISIFNKSHDCEFTFECNPSDITEELLDDLVNAGVNRLSIGVESFDKNNNEILERNSDFKDLQYKIDLIKHSGIYNYNLDLMYAIPNEKLSTVKKDLCKLISLEPTHISTYSLILEDHTVLKNNNINYIDEELDFKMYETIVKILKKKGYNHYEVSNFSKPGYESRHNLKYWNNQEYYGFGLGASGYKDAFRYTNTKNIHEYIAGKYRVDEKLMTYKEQMDNELMLGFRKLEGISIKGFYNKYGKKVEDVYDVEPLLQDKSLIYENGMLRINPDKIYVMNEILIKLI